MSDGEPSPTVRLRRLGREMRRLREEAGRTIQDVAGELEWSTSKISRLENGLTRRPDVHVVRVLCAAYGVDDEEVAGRLVALAREARRRGWWASYQDVFPGPYVGLEAEAASIKCFQLGLIPGLLQTPDYAREVTRATVPADDPAEIERRVAGRMARQRILEKDDPTRLWAVIDEAALLRTVHRPRIHQRQLRRLIETSPLAHVKLQVLPMSAGPHAGLTGQFVILDFPDPADGSVVYLETAADDLYLEETGQLDRFRGIFERLTASALSAEASLAYLSELADDT
ncbi:helix-turn-helix transcriptional regulator [Spongiactinospora sp. TRM90649]|uniref:helix-turn-helix domain-containing protein n=1 Tax=Spongiactinospora sp. TRM90649 TaxID=3031114 RepID=UPI0023F6B8AC|nr:helix-turn-helix transcriptional regulator [Spongiactinospora sp. TRM90649]MDF5756991.1 helix-turn-helix transcriptional regulator [Spongiactinospora sp. TRM90649]